MTAIAKARRSRLRASLMAGVADVFVGASALILVIITTLTPPKPRETPRLVDQTVRCAPTAVGWSLIGDDGAPVDLSAFAEKAGEQVLMVRLGIETPQRGLPCFLQADRDALAVNRERSARGAVGATLALVFIPAVVGDDGAAQ